MASREIVELFRVQDAVAGDVTRAQADVQSKLTLARAQNNTALEDSIQKRLVRYQAQ